MSSMPVSTLLKALSPLSEMPIWARLKFAEDMKGKYAWDEEMTKPRTINEIEVEGFHRTENVIWVYYTIDWSDDSRFHNYLGCVEKD